MEKKTAEETLKQIAGEQRTALMLATTKAMIIKAMEKHSSLQSEEKDKTIIQAGEALRIKEKQLKASEEIYNQACSEIERLREVLKVINKDFEQWPCKESTWKLVEQALSNQPMESDKDRRIKELEEALTRVSNCNDLATAHEYAKEKLLNPIS